MEVRWCKRWRIVDSNEDVSVSPSGAQDGTVPITQVFLHTSEDAPTFDKVCDPLNHPTGR